MPDTPATAESTAESTPSSPATSGISSAPTMVWPALQYADAHAAIAFLTDAVGFVATAVYTSEQDPSVVEHAELRWPLGGGVMLGSHRERADSPAPPPGQSACYVVTDDADALFDRVKAAGATVIREPNDTDYGSRDFSIRDPEGNVRSFGTYAGE
jgi:uncharacterized glyoxalase superfamily protein PhnB